MQFFKDISHIFFPNICLTCEATLANNEQVICTYCIYDLPTTNFTKTKSDVIIKIFYGRITLENATSLLYFKKKSLVQTLIHSLKYQNKEEVGKFLGEWLGEEMKQSNSYNTIDFIVPVPLHIERFKSRGYNQLTEFGLALSSALKTNFNASNLLKQTPNKTQTKKGRIDRIINSKELFYLNNIDTFENKHILLVDDIITTGATIEACCTELLKSKNIKISIAVMAITV